MPEPTENGRGYIVLRHHGEDHYTLLGETAATTADQACRQVAGDLISNEQLTHGVPLVSVPKRYWHEQTYKAETETRIVTA